MHQYNANGGRSGFSTRTVTLRRWQLTPGSPVTRLMVGRRYQDEREEWVVIHHVDANGLFAGFGENGMFMGHYEEDGTSLVSSKFNLVREAADASRPAAPRSGEWQAADRPMRYA